MKKLGLLMALMCSIFSFAQAPNLINYQAIVRDASGASVVSTTVGVRVSILVSSTSGATAFSEIHAPTTNNYGLINFKIGEGTIESGDLASIAWGSNDFFLKVEVDPLGGAAYSIESVSQLVAVPYALHAETVANNDDADADPANEYNTLFQITGTDLELTDGGGLLTVDLSGLVDDADADPLNEAQTLTKVGSTVTLTDVSGTGGGSFTDEIDDADADPENEAQTLSKAGSTVTLTDVGGTGGGTFTDEVDDADADAGNELITAASLGGTTLTITEAGVDHDVDLSSLQDGVDDADNDPVNEAQTISLAGSTVTLTNVSGSGGGSFSIDDADADAVNEAQTLTKVGSTVTLTDVSGTGGGTFTDEVDDADADASNEIITSAVLTGTDLEITEAGSTTTVDLSPLISGTTYRVGQHHLGGIIFWVDSTGEHGLIAAPTDAVGTYTWDEDLVPANESPSFGNYDANSQIDGAANTTSVVAHWGAVGNYACRAADDYSSGGYSDWYLPAIWELDLLIMNAYVLDLNSFDISTKYWSSTENDGFGGVSALAIGIGTKVVAYESQTVAYKVRPIKAF